MPPTVVAHIDDEPLSRDLDAQVAMQLRPAAAHHVGDVQVTDPSVAHQLVTSLAYSSVASSQVKWPASMMSSLLCGSGCWSNSALTDGTAVSRNHDIISTQ